MKKLNMALLASMALITTSAQAWEGNWLLGVSGGKVWQDSRDSLKLTVSNATSSQIYVLSNDSDNDGFFWGFLGGYSARFCNLLVGLELNVDWRRDQDNNVNFVVVAPTLGPVAGTVHYDRDAVVGITTRFGYNVLSCLMPYIRLGFEYSEMETDLTGSTTALALSIPFDESSSYHESWGFVGGVGIEYFMPCISCLSIRAEWDYHTKHHGDNLSAFIGSLVAPTYVAVNDGAQHHEQTARVSLVYNFPI